MIAALLAMAVGAAPADGRTSPREIVQTFAAMCLRNDASLENLPARAEAAGFSSVPVIPSQLENREVAAWRRGGVRLSKTAGSQNPLWKLYPMCVVTGDIGAISNDKQALNAAGEPLQVAMFDGQPGLKGSMYHLVSEKGIIDLSLNKQDRSHVVMSLLWQMGQPAPAVSH